LMAKRKRASITKTARPRRAKPQGDWAERFAMFKAAVDARKPDGLKEVKSEIARLDSRLSAVVNRRELVAQTEENVQRGMEAEAVSKFASRLAVLVARREELPDRANLRMAKLQREIDAIAGQVADLRDLIRHLKSEPLRDDDGPTPEASLKPSSRDPILTLYEAGHIGDDAVKASREIARVYEAIGRAGATRIGRMDGAGGSGGGEQELPDGIANIHHGRFLPWATRMRKQAPEKFDLVINVAVFGVALDAARRRAGLGWDRALGHLKEGLEAYWEDNESHRVVMHWPGRKSISS
jgi:hypothetical protein